jgi:hypothetical protein
MIVNNEWERMWKEVVVAYFKADLAFVCRYRVKSHEIPYSR